ncbi:MAG: peptidoglycan DD-metalloendopeptidase family protein [Desulfobacterales bacterium]|nr:peptidoglycan DD-metalloendopeptidase family protein [Desulfobacterales bacterium]
MLAFFKNRRTRCLAAALPMVLAIGLVTCRTWYEGTPPTGPLPSATEAPGVVSQPEPYAPVPAAYGISLRGLEAVRRKVRPGQSLSDILQAHGVAYGTILEAAETSRGIFNVRSLQPGRPFCVLRQTDPEAAARYFIYEKNDIDYLVFDLAEPVSVTCASKPVEILDRTVSGIIDISLWAALQQQQVDPGLAGAMSEIFAWTIDFYHLQPGDRFTAVFKENFVDGHSAGQGDITGVRFRHRGRDHYAFCFESEGVQGYFDENGESLRKAFLKAPLKYSRVSSGYSKRRLHPVTGKYRPHPGIDYAAPTGTPVLSVGDGTVVKATFGRSNGNFVTIRHNGVYRTQYLHLSRFARGISPGKAVRQGDVIGYVGCTGLATGPHLDFRFWVNGATVNPLTYDMPSAAPVDESLLTHYRLHMAIIKARLDALYTEIQTDTAKQT